MIDNRFFSGHSEKFVWERSIPSRASFRFITGLVKTLVYGSARNPFFRFSLKRSLGSGLVSIAFRRSEPSGRMDTEFGGQVIAFERDNSSTIGAGLTTQLSKLRKRHILKFFPASWGHTLSPCLKQMLEVQDGGLEHPRGHLIHALFPW